MPNKTATPKPQPTDTPTPLFASFGDGTYQVGKDIQPGTYRTRSASSNCYYERLKGFSGGIDDILVRFEAIYGNAREANRGSAFSPEASLKQAGSKQ